MINNETLLRLDYSVIGVMWSEMAQRSEIAQTGLWVKFRKRISLYNVYVTLTCFCLITADCAPSSQVWMPGMKYSSWMEKTRTAWTSLTWRQRFPKPRWLWRSTRCLPWTAVSSATCHHVAQTKRKISTRTSSPRVKVSRSSRSIIMRHSTIPDPVVGGNLKAKILKISLVS